MRAKRGTNKFLPVTIEQNVPLPVAHGAKPYTLPFDKMEVGDSFLVECTVQNFSSKRAALSQQVTRYRRVTGNRMFSVSTRTVENGFRVWRIS